MMNWLTENLNSSGYDTTLCSVYKSRYTDRLSKNVSFITFNIEETSSKLKRNTIMLWEKCIRFYHLIKRERYDIVLTVGDPCIYFVLLFRLFFSYKVIVTERVDPYHNRGIGDRLKRGMYTLCNGFVFQTNGARDYFSKKIKQNATVIPNPVVIMEGLPAWNWEKAENSIVHVGRYDPVQKRSDVLFRAFARVVKEMPDVTLEVYGGGYQCSEVECLCKDLQIEQKTVFHGVINDVYSAIVKSRIFVFTSDFEGIPNAIIEAMMVGMPVIATDCSPGGAKLLLGDNEYGYLVDCGDSETIAKVILETFKNPEMACEKAEKAKKSLERFDSVKACSLWLHYFEHINEQRDKYAAYDR